MDPQIVQQLEPLRLSSPTSESPIELSSPCQVVPTCDLSPRTSPASIGSPRTKPSPLSLLPPPISSNPHGKVTGSEINQSAEGGRDYETCRGFISDQSEPSGYGNWPDLAEIQPSLTTPDFMTASSSSCSQLNFDDFFFSSNPQQQQSLDQKLLTAFPDSTVSGGPFLLPEHHHQSLTEDEDDSCNNNNNINKSSPLNFFQPCIEQQQPRHDITTTSSGFTHQRRKPVKENFQTFSHQQQQIKLEPGSPGIDSISSGSLAAPPLFEAYGGLLKQENSGNGSGPTDLDTSLEIYRDLILRHLVQDIGSTCGKLGIPTDPQNWAPDDTLIWLQEMTAQFRLGEAPLTQLYLPGQVLTQMNKDDFLTAAPDTGDTLHAQLQIWKTAAEFQSLQIPQQVQGQQRRSSSISTTSSCGTTGSVAANRTESSSADEWLATFDPSLDGVYAAGNSAGTNGPLSIHTSNSNNNNGNQLSYPPSLCLPIVSASKLTGLPHLLPSPSDSDSGISADYDEFLMQESNLCSSLGRKRVNTSGGTMQGSGGGSIHLWQFIRELLDQPETFGQCVRWIDRTDGIFKIEDSHKLARLWGQRKNRHKMNYDKLSRSLRQYYKKNIIKKTGQRQRLIYQFIPPYHLL